MVYELRPYNTVKDWTNENDRGVIVWETDENTDASNFRICGKLISYMGFEEEEFSVPEGITSIGRRAFVKPDWDCFDSPIKVLNIPASVQTIEEGAFNFTNIDRINIHPDSPCGIIKNNGLYTKDGKTLLWVLGVDDKGEYVVPDGTVRLGANSIECQKGIVVLVLPESVAEIGIDDSGLIWDDLEKILIKAPKGSFALAFAKEHGLKHKEL